MRASASSREKGGELDLVEEVVPGADLALPAAADADPAHDGHQVLREALHEDPAQALVDALRVLVEHVHLVDEEGEPDLAVGAGLQLRDDLLEVVAEVARVVALGLRREAQRLPRGGGEVQGVHDLGHQGVEERLLGHALQVHEHGEEAPLARLVLGQDALQVVEERGLPDPALARDHEAVVVERAQHARGELLAAEEHVVVEDGRARDVGVEAPAEGPAPAQPLRAPARARRG